MTGREASVFSFCFFCFFKNELLFYSLFLKQQPAGERLPAGCGFVVTKLFELVDSQLEFGCCRRRSLQVA